MCICGEDIFLLIKLASGRSLSHQKAYMHLAKRTLWSCLGDRKCSLKNNFTVGWNKQVICLALDNIEGVACHGTNVFCLSATIREWHAAGGTPKARAHGTSFFSFFHIWWICHRCWGSITSPVRWLLSCTIARAILQFIHFLSGDWTTWMPYVWMYFPPSDWCNWGARSVVRSKSSGLSMFSLREPVWTTVCGIPGEFWAEFIFSGIVPMPDDGLRPRCRAGHLYFSEGLDLNDVGAPRMRNKPLLSWPFKLLNNGAWLLLSHTFRMTAPASRLGSISSLISTRSLSFLRAPTKERKLDVDTALHSVGNWCERFASIRLENGAHFVEILIYVRWERDCSCEGISHIYLIQCFRVS